MEKIRGRSEDCCSGSMAIPKTFRTFRINNQRYEVNWICCKDIILLREHPKIIQKENFLTYLVIR